MSTFLKSLEISGFKSFGTRTHIEFSDGITGIVGPNGCGKSNVVESLKWVLGEQSAKSVRGEKMQDIIFAGTSHRSPAGMADVSLTFNNDNGWLPLEFPEVSIGRRIFRSGEGQYFINGVRSRLKDTTELFLDTGVGKDSYAIFEQGKIDRLLSESAEERRILFEDFAGISKFKFRKEEAERKLSQARSNLDRIQETLDRLEKEIGVLEVQAADAENYNAINSELRVMETKFGLARIENMKKEISAREQEIAKIKESLSPLNDSLTEIEEQMKLNDESLGVKESGFAAMNQKNIELEKELSEVKTRYESAKKNKTSEENRLFELNLRSKQDDERIEEWEDELSDKRDAYSDALKKSQKTKELLDKAEGIQADFKARTEIIEEKLKNLSAEYGFKGMLNRGDIDNLNKNISELRGEIYVQESKIISIEDEISAKSKSLKEEKEQNTELYTQYESAKTQKDELIKQRDDISSLIKQKEQEAKDLQKLYQDALSESKTYDKMILDGMNEGLGKLKDFNAQNSRLDDLFERCRGIIAEQKIISIELFDELTGEYQKHEKHYQSLITGLFGGSYEKKMELFDTLERYSAELDRVRNDISQLRDSLSSLSEDDIFQKATELELMYSNSEKECQKLEKNINTLNQQKVQAQGILELEKSKLQTANAKLEKAESAVSSYDEEFSEIRQESFNHQEELSNAKIAFNSADTQAKSLLSDIKSLEDRVADYQRQMNVAESDKQRCVKNIENIEEEMEDLLSEQDELAPELQKLKDDLERNYNDISDLRHAKKVLDQMHKDSADKYSKLKMQEHQIEGALSERRITFENLKSSINIEDTDVVLEEQDTVDSLNSRMRSCRDRLAVLGNVNHLAIEQFQNKKEQYSSLNFQKEDIESAANDIETLIYETDKESAEKFLTAFEQIRKSYKALFSELFNGGRADLILKDKNDPLKSGIDIMAEPPGQKFQSISLLSGGQRAMVAIAVIFSILELKPTPFVILDEMDAPLDGDNIDKFKNLLTKFKGTSQFVVVSHNHSTLEACDVLFGVTMEEQGCSKVLSVAFQDAELIFQ